MDIYYYAVNKLIYKLNYYKLLISKLIYLMFLIVKQEDDDWFECNFNAFFAATLG